MERTTGQQRRCSKLVWIWTTSLMEQKDSMLIEGALKFMAAVLKVVLVRSV